MSKKGDINKLLIKTIDKNLNNNKLIMGINRYFTKKGFPIEIVEGLFNGETSVNLLTDNYKMALCRAMDEYFTSDVTGGVDLEQTKINANKGEFKLENYWTETPIHEFEGITAKKVIVNQVILENFMMKNDSEWAGYMTYEQIYNYLVLNRFYYNFDTQREPIAVDLGRGRKVLVPNINKEAVDSIAESIKNNTFEDTQIVLNCRISDSGECKMIPRITYETEELTIANIEILQKLDVIDGMHRIMGISRSIESSDNKSDVANNKIGVRLVFRTADECVNIVTQSFKRADTGKNYLSGLEINKYTKFVDKLIAVTPSLRGNVGKSFGLAIAQKSVTYKTLMTDFVKELNVDVEDFGTSTVLIKKMQVRLEEILSYKKSYVVDILSQNNDDTNNNNKNFNLLDNVNIFSVYMQVAFNLKDEVLGDFDLYNNLFDKIINLDSDTVKDLKLNSEKCSINKVISYFIG